MTSRSDSPAAVAATLTTSATRAAGTRTGQAARRTASAVDRAGAVLEERSGSVAPALGTAVGSAVAAGGDALEDVVGGTVQVAGAVRETVSGLLEEPGVRLGAALDALRGQRVGPPLAVRRWPWALGAALLGAAAGGAAAWLLQRLQGTDAPGAQEPDELEAVVDLRDPVPGAVPPGPVEQPPAP